MWATQEVVAKQANIAVIAPTGRSNWFKLMLAARTGLPVVSGRIAGRANPANAVVLVVAVVLEALLTTEDDTDMNDVGHALVLPAMLLKAPLVVAAELSTLLGALVVVGM